MLKQLDLDKLPQDLSNFIEANIHSDYSDWKTESLIEVRGKEATLYVPIYDDWSYSPDYSEISDIEEELVGFHLVNDDQHSFPDDYEHALVLQRLKLSMADKDDLWTGLEKQMERYLDKSDLNNFYRCKTISEKVTFLFDNNEVNDLLLTSEQYLDIVEHANSLLFNAGELVDLEVLPVKHGAGGYQFTNRNEATHQLKLDDSLQDTIGKELFDAIAYADIEVCFGGHGAVTVKFDKGLFNSKSELLDASFLTLEDAHRFIIENWARNSPYKPEETTVDVLPRMTTVVESNPTCPLEKLFVWYSTESKLLEDEKTTIRAEYNKLNSEYLLKGKINQRRIKAAEAFFEPLLERYNAFSNGDLIGIHNIELQQTDEWKIESDYFSSTDIISTINLVDSLKKAVS